MMNEQMTWSPVFTPPTPGPISSTTPEISWPRTAGSGNFTSPLTTCRSVWQTPHAVTLTRTSPARGAGRGRASITRAPPISDRTAAFMSRSLLTESKAQELPDDGPFPERIEGSVHRRELHLVAHQLVHRKSARLGEIEKARDIPLGDGRAHVGSQEPPLLGHQAH